MLDKLPIITPLTEDAMHLSSDAPSPRALREAAVLIPMVPLDNQWHILYIRRSCNDQDRHSGQVAFPGGRMEDIDSSHEDTALREAHEEVGIQPNGVQLLGKIAPYVTISNYAVTPVVGILEWPTTLSLQASEVARAFLVPISWLQDAQNFSYRARKEMDPLSARRHPIIVFEEFDGEILWGATARMTLNFLKAVSEGQIQVPRIG